MIYPKSKNIVIALFAGEADIQEYLEQAEEVSVPCIVLGLSLIHI